MVSLNSTRSPAPTGLTCVRRVPLRGFRADPHAGLELCWVADGWLTYQLGGDTVRVTAGQLAAFWPATPHQVLAHSEGSLDIFVATAPLSWFLSGGFPPAFVQALLHGRMVCTTPDARSGLDQRMFATWADEPANDDPEIAHAMLLELKARLLRFTLAKAPIPPTAINGERFTKADAIADFVARRCTGPITLGSIAREVQLPPKQVGRLFTRVYGTSLVQFIRRHRIFQAQRLLVTSRAKIAAVATASGFGSLSRFNSAFRQTCGCSPRHFRQLHRANHAGDFLPDEHDRITP